MRCRALLVLLLCFVTADGWPAQRHETEDERIARTLAVFREHVPPRFFEEAHGYAVLPSVKRAGMGLGGAWGRGRAYEQGEDIGEVRFWQMTSGIQTGARTFSMIVFFRNEQAMARFKENPLQFMGQAGFALFGLGRAATPAYTSDMAVFTAGGFGLMLEATIAGGKLAWRP